VRRIDVETAEQMYERVHEEIANTDIFVGCAPFRTIGRGNRRAKRSNGARRDGARARAFAGHARERRGSAEAAVHGGVRAETEDVARYAREKLERKRVDMIAAKSGRPRLRFDRETNALTVFWPGGEVALAKARSRCSRAG